MSPDIIGDARAIVRAIRFQFRGCWTLSENTCVESLVRIVHRHTATDARQERIDATARAVLASSFFAGHGPVNLASECDDCYTAAVALEAARERALLKEAK